MDSIQSQFYLAISFGLLFVTSGRAEDDRPRSTDPRLKIELFAENPQIVTPTGIEVDHDGRVWVIESNTHFPPEGYKGHPSDRILVMEGQDEAGRVKNITVFKDGLTHSMSIAVKPVWLDIVAPTADQIFSTAASKESASPVPLEVFIATRREIMLCVDTDGDLKCDKTTQLVHLETSGNYPHNGLAGFAFDALGNMFFGFGENLGADYKIIGSDGTTLSGGGEGGNVYRCRPDGSKLERWATGFWNPHASCFDAFGHLFTLDNDPDSRPPCRLLHIIEDGDYGYRFRNGRKGTHPFTAWNGEIPGTLPMVSGTGEAPSGIICYESEGLPKDYVGTLLVGSWGDHRIDKFVLKPRGASFESMPQPIIKGGDNFRPVGLAVAPDGSLYFSDWVSKEYKIHGLGRVWRVSAAAPIKPPQPASSSETLIKQAADGSATELSDILVDRRIQARKLSQSPTGRTYLKKLLNDLRSSERSRIEALWALANVPFSVEKLNLTRNGDQPANFLLKLDEVSVAASEIFNSPQLSPSKFAATKKSAPLNLVGQDLVNPKFVRSAEAAWIAFAAIQIADYEAKFNKTDTLAYFNFGNDPFLQTLAMKKLKPMDREDSVTVFGKLLENSSNIESGFKYSEFIDSGLTWLLLLGRSADPHNSKLAQRGLQVSSINARRVAVQWVGEVKLKDLRPDVEKVLGSEPMNGDLFMACLASLSLLDGVPPAEFEKAPPTQHILPILTDTSRPASLRAIALRILPPTLKELDDKLMKELVNSTDPGLKTQAVRTLALSRIPKRESLLRGIVLDDSLDAQLRADAVAGLANPDQHSKLNPVTRDLLIDLARSDKSLPVRLEAIRSLRSANTAKADESFRDLELMGAFAQLLRSDISQEPADSRSALTEALNFAMGKYKLQTVPRLLGEFSNVKVNEQDNEANPTYAARIDAGRRTFYHVNGAGCYKCHTVGGRGGQVGPDLTVIGRTMDRKKLAESILEPSKEISPQFTTWAIETTSGKVLTGMLLGEEVNGDLRLGNSQGEIFRVPFKEIESRTPLKTSVMPEKLHEMMTLGEMKDLVAFLGSLK